MIHPSIRPWVGIARLRDIAAAVHHSSTGGGNFTRDYLRGSSTFAPVTAVPEPGSRLLAACGAVLAAFASRGRRRSLFFASAIAVGLLGTAGPVGGATLYWDTNGTADGFGNAAGTWGTGGDAWWTTDSSGLFATGGTALTTSADVLHINQSNLASFSMTVSGNVDALRMVFPSTFTSTINGPGTIRVYTSGLGDANAVASGANDQRFIVNPNVVLEAAIGSTVTLSKLFNSGNGADITYNGAITSTNMVDMLFERPGLLTLNGTVDLQGGNFLSDSGASGRPKHHTIAAGVFGSGVHDVIRSGAQGTHGTDKGRLVLNANQAYTGDTFLADSIIRLLGDTSLPSTTSVFLTDTPATGSPLIELNFTGTNDISGLYFLGVEQSLGTWGAIGNASTDFQSSFFTGTGALRVVAVPEPSSLALLGFGSLLMMARRALVRRRGRKGDAAHFEKERVGFRASFHSVEMSCVPFSAPVEMSCVPFSARRINEWLREAEKDLP
jgi:hypothetical protein